MNGSFCQGKPELFSYHPSTGRICVKKREGSKIYTGSAIPKSCNMAVFHAIFHVQLRAEQNKKYARAAHNVPVNVEWPNFV